MRYLRVLLKNVSISVLVLQRHRFLHSADGSVISLVGNVIALMVSKHGCHTVFSYVARYHLKSTIDNTHNYKVCCLHRYGNNLLL